MLYIKGDPTVGKINVSLQQYNRILRKYVNESNFLYTNFINYYEYAKVTAYNRGKQLRKLSERLIKYAERHKDEPKWKVVVGGLYCDYETCWNKDYDNECSDVHFCEDSFSPLGLRPHGCYDGRCSYTINACKYVVSCDDCLETSSDSGTDEEEEEGCPYSPIEILGPGDYDCMEDPCDVGCNQEEYDCEQGVEQCGEYPSVCSFEESCQETYHGSCGEGCNVSGPSAGCYQDCGEGREQTVVCQNDGWDRDWTDPNNPIRDCNFTNVCQYSSCGNICVDRACGFTTPGTGGYGNGETTTVYDASCDQIGTCSGGYSIGTGGGVGGGTGVLPGSGGYGGETGKGDISCYFSCGYVAGRNPSCDQPCTVSAAATICGQSEANAEFYCGEYIACSEQITSSGKGDDRTFCSFKSEGGSGGGCNFTCNVCVYNSDTPCSLPTDTITICDDDCNYDYANDPNCPYNSGDGTGGYDDCADCGDTSGNANCTVGCADDGCSNMDNDDLCGQDCGDSCGLDI